MHRFVPPVAAVTLLLSGLAAHALPTELGRSADVYQNAVRNATIRTAGQVHFPGPRVRPFYFADVFGATEPPAVIFAAGIETPPFAHEADAWPAPPEPVAKVIAWQAGVETPPFVTQGQAWPALVAVTTAPPLAAPEVTVVADIHAVPPGLTSPDAATQSREIADAVAPDGAPTPVLASRRVASPITPEAGSARFGRPPFTPVVAGGPEAGIAAETEAQDGQTLMSDMADADENLVMRDGGDDGPDTMMMSSDVLFSFGSATLAEEALATLASIGKMAETVPVIEVLGHTDAIGSEANNLRLGQRRAEAVRDWLLENTAFTAEQVIATGKGETDPVAPNLLENGDDNPAGRSQNRRVEFAFHEAGYSATE